MLSIVYIPTIYILSKSIYNSYNSSILKEEKLKQISITDSLTNIYNRRFFLESSENSLKIAIREDSQLSFLMLDIDYFKNINDTFGHHCGDYILIEFTKVIKQHLRKSDLLGRLGGEEFGILLLNTSNYGTITIAQKICDIVKEHNFIYEDKKIDLTVSIGTAQKKNNFSDFDNLYKEADLNLYEAKELGRNRVISS